MPVYEKEGRACYRWEPGWDKPPRKAWSLNKQNDSLGVDADLSKSLKLPERSQKGSGNSNLFVHLLMCTFSTCLLGNFNVHRTVLIPEGGLMGQTGVNKATAFSITSGIKEVHTGDVRNTKGDYWGVQNSFTEGAFEGGPWWRSRICQREKE